MGFAERVLARAAPEQRAITEWGVSAIPGPLGNTAGGGGTFASVDLRRAENALQKVAVWSAIDLIAGVASQLPLQTYTATSDGSGKLISNPKLVEDPGGEGQGAGDWVYQYLGSKLMRGNTYGRLASPDSRYGSPTQIVLYHPDDVKGWRDRDGAVHWNVAGMELADPSLMWHRRAYPVAGQLLGLSPIGQHAATIGEGIAATRFGRQFFSDGGHPTVVLQNSEEEIDQTKATVVKSRLMSTVWGSREPLVMGRGWDFKTLQISPEESQFLETQGFTGAECCRIFGPNIAEILGYETGGSMTYANAEQRALDFLKFTLNRWLRDVEAVFTQYLPKPQYVRFDRRVLLETDLMTRYQAHQIGRNIGITNVDEIRALEDQPPLPSGQGQDYTPLLVQVAASRGIDAAQVHASEPPTGPAQRREVRTWDPAKHPHGEHGHWAKVGSLLDKLTKAGHRDSVSFSDGDYIDWASRASDGMFQFEAGTDGDSVVLDTSLHDLHEIHDELTRTLAGNTDGWYGWDDERALSWEPLDGDGARWSLGVTDKAGDQITFDWPRSRLEHLHTALTLTLLADAHEQGNTTRTQQLTAMLTVRALRRFEIEMRKATALLMDQRVAGIDTHPGGEQLKHYWVYGEGAAKWSTWTELHAHLIKYLSPAMAKRTAAEWFHLRYGFWPGADVNRVKHGKPPRGKRVGPG